MWIDISHGILKVSLGNNKAYPRRHKCLALVMPCCLGGAPKAP